METHQTIDDILTRSLINGRRETTAANQAFVEYARLGPKRSFQALLDKFETQAKAVERGDSDELPPSTRLATISSWSKDFNWQERVKIYDRLIVEERVKADEAHRLEERKHRRDILEKMRKHVENLMSKVDENVTDLKQFRTMIFAAEKYMIQSRQEMNDLPGQNFDITSGGQRLQVNFVTEQIEQSVVDARLKALGLGHLVDEQTDYTDYDSDYSPDTSKLEMVTE